MPIRTSPIAPLPALLAGLVGLAACGGDADPDREPRPPSVLLVIVDTLRADKLGVYGDERGLTPRLDRLAREGVVFSQAFSHAPWTLPATASLLTSLHPSQHGAGGLLSLSTGPQGLRVEPRFRPLGPEVPTLAETLLAAGWETGAVVNVDFLSKRFGLTRGFRHVDQEFYATNEEVRPAGRTTDAALAWLEGVAERPFFLLVHYFDPHAVYDPPPEFRRRFAADEDREDDSFAFGSREDMLRLRAGRLRLDPGVIERAERLYEGEIAYTDREIGRLLDGLEGLGLADSTLVVMTSDHGEEFLDHGGFEHGHTLYEELVRVPLLWRLPGRIEPSVVEGPVRHLDVAPTICALLGVDPPSTFEGRALFASPSTGVPPVLYHGNFWGEPLTGWRSEGWKLILAPEKPAELYHVERDPGERRDLSSAEPSQLERLRRELASHGPWVEAREAPSLELSEEEARRLEALGYLGGE